MTLSFARRAAAAATCVALGLGLSGCSFSYPLGTPPSMSVEELGTKISSQLAAQYGRAPQQVTCPELKAEVGTTINCQLTDRGRTYDVAITATGADNGKVQFTFAVAPTPVAATPTTAPTLPTSRAATVTVRGTELAREVVAEWRRQNGRTPFPVTCPTLRGVAGVKSVCKLRDRGRNFDIVVTVISVSGTNVKYFMTAVPR